MVLIYIYDITSNFLPGNRARVFGQSVVSHSFFIKIYVLCVHVKITVAFFLILEIFLIPWDGGFGGEWIHVYVWLSSFTVYLKLSHC